MKGKPNLSVIGDWKGKAPTVHITLGSVTLVLTPDEADAIALDIIRSAATTRGLFNFAQTKNKLL